MTISIANVDITTDTFSQWVTKTNLVIDALNNKVLQLDSSTGGNSAISGTFSANILTANTLSGGNTSVSANLTISTNAIFTGARTKLGLGANVQIDSGNSLYRVLTVNSAASNTLVATQITFSDISSIAISAPTNTHTLAYNSANTTWYNKVGLLVYYANGVQAYP